ncbi:MAG: cobalt transporter CbiM [Chromatiales bacterium]|jgi:cobalt/nickel transport system permease protein
MAHIPDGVLAAPVLIGGALASAALVALSLRRLDYDRIPQAAVLSAAFFVSSLITIPLGPSSVHLLLNGLMGLVLGWASVPAILVALLLQAAFFGYGGVLVLGVNTLNMALPALICAALFAPCLSRGDCRRPFRLGAMAGGLGVVLSGLMVSLAIALSREAFLPAAKVILLTYLPLALVESAVTGAVIAFVWRVAPELLQTRYASTMAPEQQHG